MTTTNFTPKPATPRRRIYQSDAEIPVADLEAARAVLARVVKHHGELYLPLFKRLDDECRARETAGNTLSRALQIADSKKH